MGHLPTFQSSEMSPHFPHSALEMVPWGAAPRLGFRNIQAPGASVCMGQRMETGPTGCASSWEPAEASRQDKGCRSPHSSHARSVSAQGGVNSPECPRVLPGEAPGPRQGLGPSWARSPQPGQMTDACGGGEHAAAPASSSDASDPELHYEEEEEGESEPSDTSSIFSDDSIYPCYELSLGAGGAGDLSLYQCCIRNDAKLVQERLEHGVTRSEATELDINGRVSGWVGTLRSRKRISQE